MDTANTANSKKVTLGDGFVLEYDPNDPQSLAYVNRVKKKLEPKGTGIEAGPLLLAAAGGALAGGLLCGWDKPTGYIIGAASGSAISGGIQHYNHRNKPAMPVYQALAEAKTAAYNPQKVHVAIQAPDAQGNTLRLLRKLQVRSGKDRLTVPKDFLSDGATVPQPFWHAVTPPIDPRSVRAAIAHDYIYRQQPEGWTRAHADRLFKRMLLQDGLQKAKANAAYVGVRNFGQQAWNDSTMKLQAIKQAARNKVKIYRQQPA